MTLSNYLLQNPQYDPLHAIPEELQAQFARDDLSVRDRREVIREIRHILRHIKTPQYTCPICRRVAPAPPVENFVVKAIVGIPTPQEIPPSEGPPSLLVEATVDEPFDGFYPFAKYSSVL